MSVVLYYDGDQPYNFLRCTAQPYDDFAKTYQPWHYVDRLLIKEPIKTYLFTDFAALPYQQTWGLSPLEGVLCERHSITAANQHEILHVWTEEQLFPVSSLIHSLDLRAIASLVKQSEVLHVAYMQHSPTDRRIVFAGNDKKGVQWIAAMYVAPATCYPSFERFAFMQFAKSVKFRDLMRAAKDVHIGSEIVIETRKPNVIIVRSPDGRKETTLSGGDVSHEATMTLWVLDRWPTAGTGDLWIDANDPARYIKFVWHKQKARFDYIVAAEKGT